MSTSLRVHSSTRVTDRQLHVRPRYRLRVLAGISLGQVDIRRLDGQAPATRDGVPAIGLEVHEDLIYLAGVGPDVPQICTQLCDQYNILTDHSPQQAFDVTNHMVQVQHFRQGDLSAAKGQKLLSEIGSPRPR